MEILDSRCAHKWLGCMLQAAQGGNPSADLQHHLQAASRAFHANRSILTNHQVSVKDRLTFFHAVVTPVACFAAGHRKIFKQELAALDVAHRKLLRRVVGPPAGMDWSRPWHEILHDSNVRVSIFVGQAGLKPWSHTCLEQHWKLGQYAVNLPCDRWLPRLLHWKPIGQRMVAIGKHCCRSLLFFAMDRDDRHLRGDGSFMYTQLFFTCAFHGPPSGIQVSLTHSLTDPHRDSYRVTFIQHQVSSSRSGRNPCCSSGCRVSRKCSNRQKKLNKIAMTCRKLIRNVVRPPPAAGWPRPWHARVVQFVQQYSMKRWSVRCLEMY